MEHEAAVAVDHQRAAPAADRRADRHRQTGADRARRRTHRRARRAESAAADCRSCTQAPSYRAPHCRRREAGAHQIHDRRVVGADAAAQRRAHAVAHLEQRRVELRIVRRRIVQAVRSTPSIASPASPTTDDRRRMRATDHAGIDVDVDQLPRRLQPMIRAVDTGLKPRTDRERYVGCCNRRRPRRGSGTGCRAQADAAPASRRGR